MLALTGAQVVSVENALITPEEATDSLEEQLALKATITEQSEERSVITLPDDAQARHDVDVALWDAIDQAVGSVNGNKLIASRQEFEHRHARNQRLTLSFQDPEILQTTNINGTVFNPQRTTVSREALSSPWKEIVQRLDL